MSSCGFYRVPRDDCCFLHIRGSGVLLHTSKEPESRYGPKVVLGLESPSLQLVGEERSMTLAAIRLCSATAYLRRLETSIYE